MTERLPSGLRWIAFDLDDTLHYFKRASGRASEAVFRAIERESGIEVGDLDQAYREILRAAQSGHFSRSKTSREYRAERFGALLERCGQEPGPRLDRLLDLYDAAPISSSPQRGSGLQRATGSSRRRSSARTASGARCSTSAIRSTATSLPRPRLE